MAEIMNWPVWMLAVGAAGLVLSLVAVFFLTKRMRVRETSKSQLAKASAAPDVTAATTKPVATARVTTSPVPPPQPPRESTASARATTSPTAQPQPAREPVGLVTPQPTPRPAPPPAAPTAEAEEAAGHHRAALALIETGDSAGAADLLRKSIRLAMSLRLHDLHARARLDLGDIAHRAGDLTTACEHWQIARNILFEHTDAALLASTEARMRENGCPTDWVLTDF